MLLPRVVRLLYSKQAGCIKVHHVSLLATNSFSSKTETLPPSSSSSSCNFLESINDSMTIRDSSPGKHFSRVPWTKTDFDCLNVEDCRLSKAKGLSQRLARRALNLSMRAVDKLSGYDKSANPFNLRKKILYTEILADVPAYTASSVCHLKGLLFRKPVNATIHLLTEQARNERIHLMTALEIHKIGFLQRLLMITVQNICCALFFTAYSISPKLCHNFIYYLESESVSNYQAFIDFYDNESIPRPITVPEFAKLYWKLSDTSTMRDLLMAIQTDKAYHREINCRLSRKLGKF